MYFIQNLSSKIFQLVEEIETHSNKFNLTFEFFTQVLCFSDENGHKYICGRVANVVDKRFNTQNIEIQHWKYLELHGKEQRIDRKTITSP